MILREARPQNLGGKKEPLQSDLLTFPLAVNQELRNKEMNSFQSLKFSIPCHEGSQERTFKFNAQSAFILFKTLIDAFKKF